MCRLVASRAASAVAAVSFYLLLSLAIISFIALFSFLSTLSLLLFRHLGLLHARGRGEVRLIVGALVVAIAASTLAILRILEFCVIVESSSVERVKELN